MQSKEEVTIDWEEFESMEQWFFKGIRDLAEQYILWLGHGCRTDYQLLRSYIYQAAEFKLMATRIYKYSNDEVVQEFEAISEFKAKLNA